MLYYKQEKQGGLQKMTKTKRPNILWICSDQQRHDTLGCYGNKLVSTPNIDALANEGICFDNCYIQNPVCSPSRASFLTGRYPSITRCRQNGQTIHHEEKLLPKLLSDEGYTCALVGKIHLSPAAPSVAPQMEERIDDGYHVFEWSHGHAPKHPTNQYHRWLKEKGVTYQTTTHEDCEWIEKGMPEEHHQTTWCAEKAMSFITECADYELPWLCSVNFFDPHPPFDPPETYLKRYTDQLENIPLPNYEEHELDDKPEYQQIQHSKSTSTNLKNIKELPADRMSERDHKYVKSAYYAMVDLIDTQVGRLVAHLKEIGQYENTIIVYMSDHGEMLGDHGMYYKGLTMYEGAVHVPLIIHWPEKLKGARYTSLMEAVEVAPTLMEAVGLPVYLGMQGKSFWDEIVSGEHKPDRDVYCEYYNSLIDGNGKNYGTMLRSGDYKLVVQHGVELGELYDLKQDPKERYNLWNDVTMNDVKLTLYKKLCDKMAWINDPLPKRIANF